jgi:hypothetical protein
LLWIIGERTTEVWYNSGANSFPFARVNNAVMQHGSGSADTVQELDNGLFWGNRDEQGESIVWRTQGFQTVRISTHTVEQAIESYGGFANATSWTYSQDGHTFYVLNFPQATWVYDCATGEWHERAYTSSGILQRHRAETHAYFNGKHIVGDYLNGNVYELSKTAYDDAGAEMTRLRRFGHTTANGKNVTVNALLIDMETGVGLDGDVQGSDPKLMLRWSKDGGRTWSAERQVSIGKIGEYRKRVRALRLGQARDWVWEIKCTDPVRTTFIAAFIDAVAGTS